MALGMRKRSCPREPSSPCFSAESTSFFKDSLDGKTRTLMELLRRVAGYVVVTPHRDRVPAPWQFNALFRGKRVILTLDDLESYAHNSVVLLDFVTRLRGACGTLLIAATCRTGSELDSVRRHLQRIYAPIPTRLELIPLLVPPGSCGRSIGSWRGLSVRVSCPRPRQPQYTRHCNKCRRRIQVVTRQRRAIRWATE
jgi:hypothetical protein